MDMKKVAQIISDAFENADITFDEFSSKTGIPKSALHRYMAGDTEKIPMDRFEAMCNALGLDAPAVLGWKPITWDHTYHELPLQKAPEWIGPDEEQELPPDKARIYSALSSLAKTDRHAAATLFTTLVEQGVL